MKWLFFFLVVCATQKSEYEIIYEMVSDELEARGYKDLVSRGRERYYNLDEKYSERLGEFRYLETILGESMRWDEFGYWTRRSNSIMHRFEVDLREIMFTTCLSSEIEYKRSLLKRLNCADDNETTEAMDFYDGLDIRRGGDVKGSEIRDKWDWLRRHYIYFRNDNMIKSIFVEYLIMLHFKEHRFPNDKDDTHTKLSLAHLLRNCKISYNDAIPDIYAPDSEILNGKIDSLINNTISDLESEDPWIQVRVLKHIKSILSCDVKKRIGLKNMALIRSYPQVHLNLEFSRIGFFAPSFDPKAFKSYFESEIPGHCKTSKDLSECLITVMDIYEGNGTEVPLETQASALKFIIENACDPSKGEPRILSMSYWY